jgi:hypothetical protein
MSTISTPPLVRTVAGADEEPTAPGDPGFTVGAHDRPVVARKARKRPRRTAAPGVARQYRVVISPTLA